MKKRLTLVFILITISTLGIVYSQLEWMGSRIGESYREIDRELTHALTWALFCHKDQQNQRWLNQLSLKFKGIYPEIGTRRKINPDSLAIYPLELSDTMQASLYKRYKLKKRVERISLYLPIRRTNDLEGIRKDKKALIVFDSLFTAKKDICRTRTELDSTAILYHLKAFLSTDRKITYTSNKTSTVVTAAMKDGTKFKDRVKIHFWCRPMLSPPLRHQSEALEYQPSDLSYYALDSKGVKTLVYASFGSAENNILISRLWWPICRSLILVLMTIIAYAYLFSIIFKQKRLAEMKDDFINNMTHELKTPIAIISAAIEGMQNFNALQDKEKASCYLETSRKELNRLNDLVNKVLHMASYEKKDVQLAKERILFNDLIADVIESFKNHSESTLNITFNNSSSTTYIEADFIHFRNAISNIIDNAIKYSGNNPVEIVINCTTSGDFLNISVADNGIGIPSSQLKQIFEKFHRVSTGNLHAVKGTGLGLSYVKYVIEMHGGTIAVKSELNKGSEFIISIPLRHE